MQHHFDVGVAVKFGILEAVIVNHMEFWIQHNEKNKQNFYDGKYWTFNSAKAFSEIFPYVSERKIRNALKHLEDEGIIVTGNYNKSAYDRTLWYAFAENANSILQFCQMEDSILSNGNVENVRPIPDNKTDNKPDNKINNNYRHFTPPTIAEVKNYCSEINATINPEAFFDYYSQIGWVCGKARSPMKDWKAAVRQWNRREGDRPKATPNGSRGQLGNAEMEAIRSVLQMGDD